MEPEKKSESPASACGWKKIEKKRTTLKDDPAYKKVKTERAKKEAEEARKGAEIAARYTHFCENRSAYNHKIRIDEQSFHDRAMTVCSYGVTKFAKYHSGEITGELCVAVQYSKEYDFLDTNIFIKVIIENSEKFILHQTRIYNDGGIPATIPANLFDDAEVIRIRAEGGIPKKKSEADIRLARKKINNILYDIDDLSFKERGLAIASLGLKSDNPDKRFTQKLMVELEMIDPDALKGSRKPTIYSALYGSDGSICDIGQVEVVYPPSGFLRQYFSMTFESSYGWFIQSIKLFMAEAPEDAKPAQLETLAAKPPKKRERPKKTVDAPPPEVQEEKDELLEPPMEEPCINEELFGDDLDESVLDEYFGGEVPSFEDLELE